MHEEENDLLEKWDHREDAVEDMQTLVNPPPTTPRELNKVYLPKRGLTGRPLAQGTPNSVQWLAPTVTSTITLIARVTGAVPGQDVVRYGGG